MRLYKFKGFVSLNDLGYGKMNYMSKTVFNSVLNFKKSGVNVLSLQELGAT